MFFFSILLSIFTAAHAQTSTNTLPLTGGGSCVQTLSCAGGGVTPPPVTPQCPSPPGTGPCTTPPPASGACPGFNNTIQLVENWLQPDRLYALTMGANDAVVVQITVGNQSTPNNSLARVVAAEYSGAPSTRIAVLSPSPCDWSAQPMLGASNNGTTVSIPFAVGTGANFGFYPIVPLNGTVYLNVKNDPGGSCIALGNCAMAIDLQHAGVSGMAAMTRALSAPVTAQTVKAARAMKAKASK